MQTLSRRKFLKSAAIVATGAAIAGFSVAGPNHWSEKVLLEELPILIPDLPAAFQEFRVGFLSDLHLASCGATDVIEQSIELLNKAKPDVILLGGDYIWLNDSLLGQFAQCAKLRKYCAREGASYERDMALADSLFQRVARVLTSLENSRSIYGVFGNHDNWSSKRSCARHLTAAGVRMLTNESATMKRAESTLTIVGVEDLWTGIPRLPDLPAKKPSNDLRILVAHNPDFFSDILNQRSFEFDLGLAGHTHGGQIRLPVVGAVHYNIEDRRLAYGLFDGDWAKVYTSRGVGVVGFPFRLNCPPEATLLRLLRA